MGEKVCEVWRMLSRSRSLDLGVAAQSLPLQSGELGEPCLGMRSETHLSLKYRRLDPHGYFHTPGIKGCGFSAKASLMAQLVKNPLAMWETWV